MRTVPILLVLVLVSVTGTAYAGPNAHAKVLLDLEGLTPGDDHVILKQQVRGNQDIDLAIYAYNVVNLSAYEIKLSYDPTLLDWNDRYTTPDNGREEENLLNSLGGSTPVFIKTEDGGIVTLANTIQNATGEIAPEGIGLLAIVSFTTKSTFTVDDAALFTLVSVEFQDPDGTKDMVLAANLRAAGVNQAEAVESFRWGQIKAMF